jgi:putative transposase
VPHSQISVRRQCALLGVNRSGLYYAPAGPSAGDLLVMRRIDEQYTRTPFYGSRRMAVSLAVNRKRVQRLMQQMGLEAIYPKPRLSANDLQHKVYPYLLRGVVVASPDQVWSTDITYIRLRAGFMYLVAILDWFSRYVLAWRLSNTLDVAFCLAALEESLSGRRRPGIFNSDQGAQFTSQDFTDRLEQEAIRVSMDGRGRVFDNIFIERLWRSVKYEEVYLKDYEGGPEARHGLGQYFRFYNQQRPHQSLGYQTPAAVYFGMSSSPAVVVC